MPYSFFEIERQKNWIIWFLFAFLITLYFLSFLACWLIVKNIWFLWSADSREEFTEFHFHFLIFKEIFLIFIIAFVVGITHWSISQNNVIEKILSLLRSEPLDPQDKYHCILKNIVEEASVACGGMKFEVNVIPISALNAFSIADFSGRKVIGLTEGILAKLDRRQIQAVVGHEIAHILSGDCLSSTVTCSLFELYAAILGSLEQKWEDITERKGSYVLIPIYIILVITRYMSYLTNIFISRQREYRADAISARLTRDPLSLAEALYIISRGWKGEGIGADALSSIFIVNPRYSSLDEQEGFLSDMLSTHPPIKKRIEILLGIAGRDIKFLEEAITTRRVHIKKPEVPLIPSEKKWYIANTERQWIGPFDLTELLNFDWLRPYSWVRKVEEDKAKFAYEDSELKELFQIATSTSAISSKYSCPNCYQAMEEINYEGRLIWGCAFCKALLLEMQDFKRILIREEKSFPEEVMKKAELLLRDSKVKLKKDTHIINTPNLIHCPQCNKKMQRVFFNWGEFMGMLNLEQQDKITRELIIRTAIPLVIDKCIWCGLYWFEHNKIEILQYIYEKYQNAEQ